LNGEVVQPCALKIGPSRNGGSAPGRRLFPPAARSAWRRDRNRWTRNRTRNRARGEALSHASRLEWNVKRRCLAAGLAPGVLADLRRRAEMICQGGARAMANFTLRDLEKRVQERAKASAHTSYTRRLLDQGVAHCAKKLGEEAIETVLAAVEEDRARLIAEAADLIYHLLVVLEARGISLADVEAKLAERTRRSGLTEKASRKGG